MSLPRFLASAFPGFEVIDLKEWLSEGRIEVHLRAQEDRPWRCHRCGEGLKPARAGSKYRARVEAMPVMGLRLFVHFWRERGACPGCRKLRAERIGWIAEETPHLAQDYAWWLGRLCEIAAVSRVAEMFGRDETSLWRLDLARMRRMLARYRIPEVSAISVDEVYARKKPKYAGESRDDRFFTVISDLNTHKVIWVSESRRRAALDQFFLLIGKEACEKIEVVATDQHDGYAASIAEHLPRATHVWDKFHLMQVFGDAVNEARKSLHDEQARGSLLAERTRGQYRFLFVKKATRRTGPERAHLDEVLSANREFTKLELIKERMLTFFDCQTEDEAKLVWAEVGDWIFQAGFQPLMRWYRSLEPHWNRLASYFRYRVTSALSEGINNVIKTLKRRAYGYKNMEYFRLKILQQCGYLNSRHIPHPGLLG
ncbi:MAG: ISL3 family transposase [Candidatus Omnitrophica bacterium]|nr:ISL3 family transposase [Candidatus Omnitrophota bacterium]